MKGECVLIHLDISTFCVRDQDASGTPTKPQVTGELDMWNGSAYLSVASLSFSMALRSSVLPAADRLVRGVFTELPLTDPVGVDVEVDEAPTFCLAACLAAFSARRFCLDADWGGMSVSCRE